MVGNVPKSISFGLNTCNRCLLQISFFFFFLYFQAFKQNVPTLLFNLVCSSILLTISLLLRKLTLTNIQILNLCDGGWLYYFENEFIEIECGYGRLYVRRIVSRTRNNAKGWTLFVWWTIVNCYYRQIIKWIDVMFCCMCKMRSVASGFWHNGNYNYRTIRSYVRFS